MKNDGVVRNYYILPCCLLLLNLCVELVSYKGDVVAAPLGVHRINTVLYNRHLFARLGLRAPRSWAEFAAVARSTWAEVSR